MKNRLPINIRLNRWLVFVGLFGAIAGLLILASHASSPYASLEPEQGNATQVLTGNSVATSGQKFVEFGTHISGSTYYIDCNGSDTNNGTAPATAWKSLAKANTATLAVGDGIAFKRGCTFNGSLNIKWAGVAIISYGSGAQPLFQSAVNNTNIINVTGSNNIIDGLNVAALAPSTDPACSNNAVGHVVDFYLANGATGNTIKNSIASGAYAGVFIASGATNNHVTNNQIVNNTMMSPLDNINNNNDAGAFGVLLWGDNNDISYNQINGSDACSYDYGRDGSAVEVFNGSNNSIHHNKASNDIAFTELGKDISHTSTGNTYAYNLYTYTNSSQGIFLNIHGKANTNLGPVTDTKAYDNDVYITASSGPGAVVCNGCGTDILTLRNNIIWDNVKGLWTDVAFNESNNIFWSASGIPIIQGITIDSTSKKVDPKFVVSGSDFHLQASSPAIDAGSIESVNSGFNRDLDNNAVPLNAIVDVGAYEY